MDGRVIEICNSSLNTYDLNARARFVCLIFQILGESPESLTYDETNHCIQDYETSLVKLTSN